MNGPEPLTEFEKAARESDKQGIVREFFGFLSTNKKWWLLPVVICLLILGLLVFLSGTGFAPFVYSLF
jgi:hypothetical protein